MSISSDDASLDYSQIDVISNLTNIESVAPYKTVSSTVTRGENTSTRASIVATTADYMNVMNLTISKRKITFANRFRKQ